MNVVSDSFESPYVEPGVVEREETCGDDCVFTAVRRGSQSLTSWYDARLADSGLRATMYRLLSQVESGPPSNISTLAERLGLDRSTLGRNLRVLERAGLVGLRPASDERARLVDLTDRGRHALAVAAPLWARANADLRASLGARADHLLDILSALPPNDV